MEGTNILSAEERLKRLETERKELRVEVNKERTEKLLRESENRNKRDEKLKKISAVLIKIQKEIYMYNRSGKVAKDKTNVLETLEKLVEEGKNLE